MLCISNLALAGLYLAQLNVFYNLFNFCSNSTVSWPFNVWEFLVMTKICSYFVSYSSGHDHCTIAVCTQVGWALNMYVYNVILWITKPELNMLKIVLIIPSSTSQKFTHYSYFIPISLAIIPILFFYINISGTYWHLEKQELGFVVDAYIVQILVIQVKYWSMKVILTFS